jgi:hypothetical protein
MLRDGVVVEPVEPLPRCAAAIVATIMTTKAIRALNRTELSTMTASLQSQNDFQIGDPEMNPWGYDLHMVRLLSFTGHGNFMKKTLQR